VIRLRCHLTLTFDIESCLSLYCSCCRLNLKFCCLESMAAQCCNCLLLFSSCVYCRFVYRRTHIPFISKISRRCHLHKSNVANVHCTSLIPAKTSVSILQAKAPRALYKNGLLYLLQQTFNEHVINAWNSLPANTVDFSTLSRFRCSVSNVDVTSVILVLIYFLVLVLVFQEFLRFIFVLVFIIFSFSFANYFLVLISF